MIVNPDKLMLLQQFTKQVIQEKLQIDSHETESENSVTLLGITIDNRLSFDNHISKLTVSYISISITAPLCGVLVLINLLKKLKIYISVVLD